jgi:uncharacterized protein YgiM (DUF1202 family)
VRRVAVLLLALAAVRAPAATAYVSDDLLLTVYAETNNQGQRLTTLHSGAVLETLGTEGDYTQVRLADGITGWAKSSYLTSREPAVLRIKKLEEELDRARASPAGQSEAAARSELEQLHHTLQDKQQEIDTLHARAQTQGSTASPPARADIVPVGAGGGWLTAVLVLLAAGAGFWLGYATLARRVRTRFGGIKVY